MIMDRLNFVKITTKQNLEGQRKDICDQLQQKIVNFAAKVETEQAKTGESHADFK